MNFPFPFGFVLRFKNNFFKKKKSLREIMQVGEIEFFLKNTFLFWIIKESLIIKSLIKNLKFYLKEGKLNLLRGFDQSMQFGNFHYLHLPKSFIILRFQFNIK
jgi:hypothetical protein